MTTTFRAADLFCGAGGFSTGLLQAAAAQGVEVELLAVNHWTLAIETHQLNHPAVRHLCQSVDQIRPLDAVPSGKLDLLLASPECVHFSVARGGKPMSDQSRSSAWCILRWLDELDVAHVLIENVPEFESWGPLYPDDHPDPAKRSRPIPSKRGSYFRNFLRNLRALGYRVDYRSLVAADYGDPTTRKRLFLQAWKGRRCPTWPEPTHTRPATATPQERLWADTPRRPWRTARECIDLTDHGESIYRRSKPLRPSTLMRIYAGLKRFSSLPVHLPPGADDGFPAHPFLVVRDTSGSDSGSPFLCQLTQKERAPEHSVSDINAPFRTMTTRHDVALVEPFIVGTGGPTGASRPRSIDDPFGTVLAENHRGMVSPYLVEFYGTGGAQSLDEPLRTITCSGNHHGLIAPWLVGQYSPPPGQEAQVRSLDDPIPTITGACGIGIANPYLIQYNGCRDGQGPRCRSIDRPMPTLAASVTHAVMSPFLVAYYGSNEGAQSVDEPMPTITTRDRFALVHPQLVECGAVSDEVVGWLDIRFRMLRPREMAHGMSFPANYSFAGTNRDRVKQIGNAVPVRLARALTAHVMAGGAR